MGEPLMRTRGFCSQLRDTFPLPRALFPTVTMPNCRWSPWIRSGAVANGTETVTKRCGEGSRAAFRGFIEFLLHRGHGKIEDKSSQCVTYLPNKLRRHPHSTPFRLNELIWRPRWKESLSLSVNKASLSCVEFLRKKKTFHKHIKLM